MATKQQATVCLLFARHCFKFGSGQLNFSRETAADMNAKVACNQSWRVQTNVHVAAQQMKPDCLQQAVNKNFAQIHARCWPHGHDQGGRKNNVRLVMSSLSGTLFRGPSFEDSRQAPYGKASRITFEFESHGHENWHAPRSIDVHGSHGLMSVTLFMDTSCNAVAHILHMQVRLPRLLNGASLATAIPKSPRRPLHI